jgi:protein arginine kinase activator
MICQECNQRPATLHFTKILNGEKTEVHLCDKCAQDKGDMFMMDGTSGFPFHNLLAGLLNVDHAFPKQPKKDAFQQQEIIQCPHCQMTFQQFVKVGRFGCSNCYVAFREQLKPILKRLHSGNWTHNGKIPKKIGGSIRLKKELDEKKNQLKDLITREEFESAAILRDEIRLLEKKMNDGSEGGE